MNMLQDFMGVSHDLDPIVWSVGVPWFFNIDWLLYFYDGNRFVVFDPGCGIVILVLCMVVNCYGDHYAQGLWLLLQRIGILAFGRKYPTIHHCCCRVEDRWFFKNGSCKSPYWCSQDFNPKADVVIKFSRGLHLHSELMTCS
ncbi:hypothetical protein L6452_40638 [Arctium lappa]|uniref:Uncharacterized protein n=1 Tax=Arctium lappa TaxID=4217 RepID=A0ACB8XMU1_ARCLA|nr:hypothetical protein L6452_40638 [Arctium lappa]